MYVPPGQTNVQQYATENNAYALGENRITTLPVLAKGVSTQRNMAQALDLDKVKVSPYDSASQVKKERPQLEQLKKSGQSLPKLPRQAEPELNNFYTKRE